MADHCRCPRGKLTWAGRAWARGGLSEDAVADNAWSDAAIWGIDPALLGLPDEDGIWAENLTALRAFLSVASQMRIQDGCALGLDYAGSRAGLALAGIRVRPEVWADLQIIEAGAVAALNGK